MESIRNILNNYGVLITESLKENVRPLSATGATERSVKYGVDSDGATDTLTIFARAFFATLETGRGPRKSGQQGEFLEGMIEYLKARGLTAGLTDKQIRSKARSLTYLINRDGDKTFQQGGRQVYSNDLDKLIAALHAALKKDFVLSFRNNLKKAFVT